MPRPEVPQSFYSPEGKHSLPSSSFERGVPPQRVVEEQPKVLELQPFKEQWIPTFNVLTVSGHPGSGKTVQALAHAYCYGIEVITPSLKFRKEIEEMGQQVRGGAKRPEEMDKALDKAQLELIDEVYKNNSSIILESRLGGVLATEYLLDFEKGHKKNTSLPPPQIIRGLWVANRDIRAKRVASRDKTTIDQAKHDTTDRERVDFEMWRKLHPKLLKDVKDVFDPSLVANLKKKNMDRIHGTRGRNIIYDFKIRTSTQSFEDSFMSVHNYLADNGFIVRVEDVNIVDKQSFNPQGEDIVSFT